MKKTKRVLMEVTAWAVVMLIIISLFKYVIYG